MAEPHIQALLEEIGAAGDQAQFHFGVRHSMLFVGFAVMLHRQARENGLDTLYFFTREGEFLRAVFDALHARGDGHTVASELLEVSRLATFGPSLGSLDPNSLMNLWRQYASQSPRSLLASLNLAGQPLEACFSREGLEMDELIHQPWRSPALARVLEAAEFKSIAGRQLASDRELALAYLDPFFSGRELLGVVDIGWRGSIQDNLARLWPDRHFFGHYLGLARYFNPQPANVSKLALGPDRNRSAADYDLLHAVDVIELISNSPNGSTQRYLRDEQGTVRAERGVSAAEEAVFESFTRHFQAGVIWAAGELGTRGALEGRSFDSIRSEALEAWRGLLNQPHEALVRAYFSLKHNEVFGMGRHYDKAWTPGLGQLLAWPWSPTGREKLRTWAKYSQWTGGLLKRRDLPRHKRLLLYALIRSALAFKAIRHRRPRQASG
jgi:hypothetical protein